MSMQQVAEGQANPEIVINRNSQTLEHQATYGQRQSAHSGLTWGYYGGRWGGFSVSDGTLSLGASATNYVVVLRSSGAISVSTSSTNWNDATNYARVYQIVTGASSVSTIQDHRAGPGGVHGQSSSTGGAGTEMKGLTFTSDTDSTAASDPGNGLFKWNNATQGSATTLYIDNQTADGVSLTTLWAALAQTGRLYIQQSTDAARWQQWSYTAHADSTGYRSFTVTLEAKSSSDIQDAAVCYFDFDEDNSGSSGTTGKHAIYIAAGSMRPSATGGCASLAGVASAANQPDIVTLDFDTSTEEYAQFSIVMPKSWNEGTVSFKAHWSHAATTTNFGVAWKLQAVAVSDDDAIATAFGTAVAVTDTGGTTNDLYTTAESSAITVAGSPAAEDMVFFRVFREPSNGSDNLGVDARLHGITLYITTDAENDA